MRKLRALPHCLQARLSLAPPSDPGKAWITLVMVAGFGAEKSGGGLRPFVDKRARPSMLQPLPAADRMVAAKLSMPISIIVDSTRYGRNHAV